MAEKLRTREVAYASDIHSAYQALRLNNLGLAKRIVNRNREFPDGPDLRNWEWRALWLQCRGDEISTFGDRRDSITSIQYSPDGKWLAVGEAEEGIRVWDIATGKLSHTLVQKVPKQFGFVAFTPAGDRLYATAADGVVKAWNVPTFNAADIRLRHGGRDPRHRNLAKRRVVGCLWIRQRDYPVAIGRPYATCEIIRRSRWRRHAW